MDASGSRSALRWLIERLAKHPGWVTLVTFVAGAVVAGVVLGIDERLTLTDVVTLLATLWALFFAVMIYLLSAEDTEHILGQISDLQDQLSTALSEPEDAEAEDVSESEDAAGDEPAPDQPDEPQALPRTGELVSTGAQPAGGNRTAPDLEVADAPATGRADAAEPVRARGRSRDGRLRMLTTPAEIAETVPSELVAGWSRGTGLPDSAIRRAWSRDPGRRQWVIETEDARWLAFFRHGDDVALVPLHPDWGGDRRSRSRQGGPRAGRPQEGGPKSSSRGGPFGGGPRPDGRGDSPTQRQG